MPDQRRYDEPARIRRSKAACKACRQSKVKCGMECPPCTRCQRMGYACEWDPQFKRTRIQDRFRELEQRLEGLQHAESVVRGHPVAASACNRLESVIGPSTTSDSSKGEDAGEALATEPHATPDGGCYAVRNLTLSLDDAATLFSKFFDKYHVHVPFLDPDLESEKCYQNSQFLFWAIVSVAVREQQPQVDFLSRLSPYFKDALGEIALGCASSFREVQALVLLALWPPFNARFWCDRSMNLTTIAITTATYLGLHNPYYEQEYTNKPIEVSHAVRAEKARTWVACLSVAQGQSMDSGLPVHLPFTNWNVQEIANLASAFDIPRELHHYLVIQQHAYRIFVNMPQRGQSATNSMYHGMLQEYLGTTDMDLQRSMDSSITSMPLLNKIRYATVQLHLRSMYFQIDPSLIVQKLGILKAYSSATSFVDTLISEDGASDILQYSPRTMFRTLLLAACVIFKVLFSSYALDVDSNLGKMLYNAAALCMRQQAVQYKDLSDGTLRCAGFLRRLWQVGENSPSMRFTPPQIVVQTRFGAGIIHHCLAVFFDRLPLLEQQAIQEESANTEAQNYDGLEAMQWPGLDLNMSSVGFPMNFPWDLGATSPQLQSSE